MVDQVPCVPFEKKVAIIIVIVSLVTEEPFLVWPGTVVFTVVRMLIGKPNVIRTKLDVGLGKFQVNGSLVESLSQLVQPMVF
jgi:hypothetical protein